MSIEMFNRLSLGNNAVNIEGTAVDSVTRELAHGQEGVIDAVDKYIGGIDRIIRDDTLSEKGTAAKRLELGKETNREIQRISVVHSRRAKKRLAELEQDLKIGKGMKIAINGKKIEWTTENGVEILKGPSKKQAIAWVRDVLDGTELGQRLARALCNLTDDERQDVLRVLDEAEKKKEKRVRRPTTIGEQIGAAVEEAYRREATVEEVV